jgi:hypothetical protein
MKLILLFPFFLASTAFAGMDYQVRYNDFGMPNVVCPYYYKNGKWISQGPWYGYWGEVVNTSLAFWDRYGGYGLCTTEFYDEKKDQTLIKFIQYFSETPFEIDPTTCQIHAALKFEVLQAVKMPSVRGEAYEMTTDVQDPLSEVKKIKMINYFLSGTEARDWPFQYDLVNKKCLDLFPEAVPWEP